MSSERSDAEQWLREVFLAARLRWQAVPSEPEAAGALGEEWARLEDRLEQPEHAALRRQVLAEAAGAPYPDSVHSPRDSAEDDPLPALPLAQEAVRLMEEVYFRLPLGGAPGSAAHRRSLAWLNRFGRWTGAPTFRRWWPWLVPLYSGEAIDYLHRALGLPEFPGRGTVRPLDPEVDAEQHAFCRWRCEQSAGRPHAMVETQLEAERSWFGFFLPFEPPWRELNAAVAVVDWAAEAPLVARWRAQDLYVPPGLWGIGIGELFLRELLEHLSAAGCRLVQVEAPPPSKSGAHWHTLYSGAHFLRRTVSGTGGEQSTLFERRIGRRSAPPESSAG